MKTKILLFFMVLSCSIIYGQRDSLYINKIQTYEPIDTAEITVGTEYEVLLKHYSIYGGSVIRRDTVDTYAAEYIRGLIVIAEKDSANLKSFLEVHHENFKNVNTEYFNIKNYLTALRNAATGRPMERQTPLEPAVEKQYIGRVINGTFRETTNVDSLIIGATYKIFGYVSGDDFTNVGASVNADGEHFVATGKYPANWTNTSQITIDTIHTYQESGTLTVGKVYYIPDPACCGDDFSNLISLTSNRIYTQYPGTSDLTNYYYINEQPTDWTNDTPITSSYLPSIELKNDLGANVYYYHMSDYSIIIACDLPIFNNSAYYVNMYSSNSRSDELHIIPITDKVAVIQNKDIDAIIYQLYFTITKFIQP